MDWTLQMIGVVSLFIIAIFLLVLYAVLLVLSAKKFKIAKELIMPLIELAKIILVGLLGYIVGKGGL